MTRRPRAFTLMEVLVAIALVGALLGSMFTFLLNLLSTRDRALEATGRRLAASTLVEHLERDLMTCVVGDLASGAGIEGDNTTLKIMTRSVAAHRAELGLRDAHVLNDLQIHEYRFDETSGLMEARRVEPGTSPSPDRGFEPLGRVHRLRLRYRDEEGWRDDFNSLDAGTLPKAIEIAVWYRPWPGETELEPTAEEPDPFDFADGGFDESAYDGDIIFMDEPRPDRFRVIAIPDGATDDPYASDDEATLDEEVPAT